MKLLVIYGHPKVIEAVISYDDGSVVTIAFDNIHLIAKYLDGYKKI